MCIPPLPANKVYKGRKVLVLCLPFSSPLTTLCVNCRTTVNWLAQWPKEYNTSTQRMETRRVEFCDFTFTQKKKNCHHHHHHHHHYRKVQSSYAVGFLLKRLVYNKGEKSRFVKKVTFVVVRFLLFGWIELTGLCTVAVTCWPVTHLTVCLDLIRLIGYAIRENEGCLIHHSLFWFVRLPVSRELQITVTIRSTK